jgi:hypothetical protein
MHGSSRFEHRPRPHCPQGSTVWQPLFPSSVWQSMIAADSPMICSLLLWREASMAADQSQACTRTHAQQPHNCRLPISSEPPHLLQSASHFCPQIAGRGSAIEFGQLAYKFTEYVPPTSARSRPWWTRAERARCCLRHRARKAFSSARSLTTRSARTRSLCVPASQLWRGVHTLFITRDGMV